MTTILIVEDDRIIRSLINEVKRDEGYEVLLASDGEAGVELARRHQPSLILMDLMLAKLDGHSAIRAPKDDPRTRDIRIIAMSAGSNLLHHIDQLRADGVLGK